MSAAATTSRSSTFTERDVRKGAIELIAMDTPVSSTLVKKGPKPLETTPEWELKTYGTPVTTGVIEGEKPSSSDFQNNLSNKYMLKGRFIKQWRPVAVTKEMQLMGNQYNRPDALADNIMDKSKELYVDVEAFTLSDNEAAAPVASTTASSGRGIFRWLSNANGRFTDSDTTPVAAVRTPTGSILVSKTNASDITETEIAGLITSVAKARKKAGMRFMGVCTPEMRDAFDSYSRTDKSYTTSAFPVSRFSQKQGSIDREVTFYKSANGTVELLTSFQLDSTVHFGLLSPDLIEMRYAQPVLVNPDHSTSAQVKEREIDVIYVLECLNPQAHGKAITGATA
jgi:hypothetical protein